MKLQNLLTLIKSYTKIKLRTLNGEEFYTNYIELVEDYASNYEVYEIFPDSLDDSLVLCLGEYDK